MGEVLAMNSTRAAGRRFRTRSGRSGSVLFAAVLALPLATLAVMVTAPAAGAASVPGAPRAVSAVPLNGGAKVSWSAPSSNGSSAIVGYIVTPYRGTVALPPRPFASAKTAESITGLTNAKAYSFKVIARNVVGKGPLSGMSGATIVGAPGRPGNASSYVPPRTLGQIGIYVPPPLNNGSNITRFNATCTSSSGGVTVSGVRQNPAVHIVILSGLTTGKTYSCWVTATNARGTGPRSKATPLFVAP